MGYIPMPTPGMGPFYVEVRNESFYLHTGFGTERRMWAYKHSDESQNPTLELTLADIPAIRAALDLVERVAGGEKEL